MICDQLGFEREFRLSSSLPSGLKRSQRVAELLQWCGAGRYFSARGAFGYMHEDGLFPVTGVEVLFQDFKPVEYPQVGTTDGFVPFLSVLDALLNVGPEATAQLIVSGTQHWVGWNEMVATALAEEEIREHPDRD